MEELYKILCQLYSREIWKKLESCEAVRFQLRNYEYFLMTVLFIKKQKKCYWKDWRFYCIELLLFSAENLLRFFKNRSRRARVDQIDIKFVFCMKYFCGVITPLKVWRDIYSTFSSQKLLFLLVNSILKDYLNTENLSVRRCIVRVLNIKYTFVAYNLWFCDQKSKLKKILALLLETSLIQF